MVGDGTRRRLPLFEVKYGMRVGRYDTVGLRHFMDDFAVKRGYVVTRGDEQRNLGNGIIALPWEAIARGQTTPWESA